MRYRDGLDPSFFFITVASWDSVSAREGDGKGTKALASSRQDMSALDDESFTHELAC